MIENYRSGGTNDATNEYFFSLDRPTVCERLGAEVDARAALLASMEAMGADELETIEYSGSGFSSRIGQQYSVNGGWPTFQVVDYTRTIDFDAGWSREDYTRSRVTIRHSARTPMAPVRVTAVVNGAYAWDIRGDEPVPLLRPYLDGIAHNELRQLEIAITPMVSEGGAGCR